MKDLFKEIDIDGINYNIDEMNNLSYVIGKMNEYVNKIGFKLFGYSKKDLAKRDVVSPNLADSFIMAYSLPPKQIIQIKASYYK